MRGRDSRAREFTQVHLRVENVSEVLSRLRLLSVHRLVTSKAARNKQTTREVSLHLSQGLLMPAQVMRNQCELGRGEAPYRSHHDDSKIAVNMCRARNERVHYNPIIGVLLSQKL